MTQDASRRRFLKGSSLLLSFVVAGENVLLTPVQARSRQVPLRSLTKQQAKVLAVLAETIVPGAKQAGIVHFIDSQLSAEPEESLLMLRYLGVPTPHNGFYTASLDSAETAAQTRHKKPLADLDASLVTTIVNEIAQDQVDDWTGPPASFFYFVLRSDAIDVTYGTEQGFEELGTPYMAHITPPSRW